MESTPAAPPAAHEPALVDTAPTSSRRGVWLGFGLLALLFAPTLLSFGEVWSAQPYTHGWLIAAASVWMVWNERDALRAAGEGGWGVALLVAGLSIVWFLGAVADLRAIAQAAVPLIFLGWAITIFPAAIRRLAPVGAFTLLAVPLWEVLTPPLQSMTIAVNAAVMRILGIPARIDGSLVHLERGTFVIESGCAGLNYLMSGLTIGALHAYVSTPRPRARLMIVGLAALLAIVGNWVRVSSLIAQGQYTHMRSIFVTDSLAHITYGWSIFVLGLFLFFPLAGRIARDGRATIENSTRVAAVSWTLPGPALRTLVPATLAAGLGPLLFYTIGVIPGREPAPLSIGPASPGSGWSMNAAADRPYAWQPAFVGADEHVTSVWASDATTVVVDRMVYHDQEQGAELVGYLNAIAEPERLLSAPVSGHAGNGRIVNVAVVRDEHTPVLVWFWYRVGGIETASAAKAKLLEVPAYVARVETAELIAVSSACEPDSCRAAAETLAAFLSRSDG